MNGEDPQIKYISLNMERIILVMDHSNNEIPFHNFEWKTNTPLGKILEIMKRLYVAARYDYDKQEKRIDEESVCRTIAVGRKNREEKLRFHPLENFCQHSDPILQIKNEDVCLSLFTPQYHLNCYNFSYQEETAKVCRTAGDRNLPLLLDDYTLNKMCSRPIKEGINRIEASAYSNISEIVAELIMETSPAFAKYASEKTVLTRKLDQLLAQYPKPQKLN